VPFVTATTFVSNPPPADSAGAPAAQHLLAGQQHYDHGRIGEAITVFSSGLEAAAREAGDDATVATTADLHAKLGNAYMRCGQLDLAAMNYQAALRLAPHLTSCWCNLGNVQLQTGHAQDAISLYLQALKLNPVHWPSRANLAQAVMATRQYLVARALLSELAEERPHDGAIRRELGKACFELNDIDAAIEHFEAAVAINGNDAESLYWIGGIRQKAGDNEAAQAAYVAAAQIQPLIRRAAAKPPADFRVLALYAPFAGNTPSEYLFKEACHDTDTLALLASREPDATALGEVDVVVNLISDADQAGAVLPLASRLVARLGKPTINDPGKIQRTTRDAVAELLPGIARCRIPQILRLAAAGDVGVVALQALLPFSFPVLARPAGTHGGDDFERISDIAELASFVAQRPDSDHYVIEYIDYTSADGHFRKYRFIFVGDEILPYHLAIGNDWKVHHVSTDMAHRPWMQEEEAAFLADPGAVFDASHYQALRTVRERIGLDYFGIDCGLDANGNLIVFEVNASMLVHDDNAEYPYKDPFVRAIKQAFDAMLRNRAGRDLPAQLADAPPLSP
jgi:tetratricopeptide (TPR) repeat protein/glutathione synthase/RimK-type ligase-like ATP-grasp enzyme